MTPIRFLLTATLALPALALAEGRPPPPPDARDLMEIVREKYPERFERLKHLRAEDPEAFRKALRRIRERMGTGPGHEQSESKEDKEAMRGLLDKFKATLEDFQEANADDRADLRSNLVELAGEIFDAKQAHREARLEKMRSRLGDLEQEIAERTDQRETLIEQFVEEKTTARLKGL
jgi:HD-GYP domain-containing protein (c-di-GMP phosphodiesterase class II)